MRNAGIDQRDELVLRFKLSVENVGCHIYDLKQLHFLVAFEIVFLFELNVLKLELLVAFRSLL